MTITRIPAMALIAFAAATTALAADPVYYDVARGSHPHDVAAAPTPGGPVYYTAQSTGKLGILNPVTGKYDEVALGARSSPHGVVVGPDGAPWITDGGQNAIVRVDPVTRQVRKSPPFRRQVGIGTLARRGGRAGNMDVLAITDFS